MMRSGLPAGTVRPQRSPIPGSRDGGACRKGRSGDDPPSTEFLHLRQPYASEADVRQHYVLPHLKELYQRTANKGVGGWAAARLWFIRGKVMVKVGLGCAVFGIGPRQAPFFFF